MPRIKIELPERFSFSTEIPIYINHINYGNHLDNSALISLVSEARVRFFKALGYTELDVEGCGIVVADVAAQLGGGSLAGPAAAGSGLPGSEGSVIGWATLINDRKEPA